MTPDDLVAIYDCSLNRANIWAEPLSAAMAAYSVDTPERQAAFLAQVGHESGYLIYVKELWGQTPAQTGYEGRSDLGNSQPGDGYRYRGRGLIQVTGRSNYSRVGIALGLDLVGHPELLEQPAYAAMSAGWFWQSHGCNELADANQFEQITRRINGGLNGQPDRLAIWAKAKELFQIQ